MNESFLTSGAVNDPFMTSGEVGHSRPLPR